jgi:lipoprotein NlpD
MRRVVCLIAFLVLAGCGSHPPVPVVDANPSVVVEGAQRADVPVQAREGFYIIKKGDNLYRIAIAHGVTTQDLVTWNALADETKLNIGQELRVMPPEGVVEIKPIEAPAPITVVGDNGAPTGTPQVTTGEVATSTASAGSTGSAAGVGMLREPKGGKIAYSESALAQARAMEGGTTPQPSEAIPPAPTPAPAPAPTTPAVPAVPPPTPAPTPAAAPAPAAAEGVDWTWPVAGKVIRGFGKNSGGEISRGIDVAGRKGEAILAAAAGKVTFVGALEKYGDFVVVRHDGDYLSVYAHTSKILVKRDQMVTKGQKIAEVGSSGTDQPKLHFEIRHKSEPVDPVKLLPPRQ